MALPEIQKRFENIVLKNPNDHIFLEKFKDGEKWGTEDLTNCYHETSTEMCFYFFGLGLNSKEKDYFEKKVLISTGNKEENFSLDENGNYNDGYIQVLWKYFQLS